MKEAAMREAGVHPGYLLTPPCASQEAPLCVQLQRWTATKQPPLLHSSTVPLLSPHLQKNTLSSASAPPHNYSSIQSRMEKKMVPTLSLNPPARLSPSSPPSSLSCMLHPWPSPPPLATALLSLVTEGGLAWNGMHKLIHHTAVWDANRPSLGARQELISEHSAGAGCRPRQSAVVALLCRAWSPLSSFYSPSVCPYGHKQMMGATAETKTQPSNQVMESIKSITEMSKHNHIFVRLRGGQQGGWRQSLLRLAPALTRTATLHIESASWELTPL